MLTHQECRGGNRVEDLSLSDASCGAGRARDFVAVRDDHGFTASAGCFANFSGGLLFRRFVGDKTISPRGVTKLIALGFECSSSSLSSGRPGESLVDFR